MRHLIFLLLSISFISQSVIAQNPICGDKLNKYLLSKQYANYETLLERAYADAMETTVEFRDGDTLTIPVVVHVIYNTPAQNLSDELVHGQIDVLNEDFLRQNEDASQTREIFLDVAASANIQFELATLDPDGNPTTGITRTETDVESFTNIDFNLILEAIAACGFDVECIAEYIGDTGLDLDLMKDADTGGVDPWDVDSYLNIWVCNLSADLGAGPQPFLLGFAYPPVGAPNFPTDGLPENYWEKDGVVVHYEAFGRNNPQAGVLTGISDRGRTCTHEVGHYLGLRHIWGDGDCTMDDGLIDTPDAGSNSQPQDIANVPECSTLHEKDSCTEDNLPDMIENYMDYSVESCQNMFTQEQVNLMRNMLEGPRAGLLGNGSTNTSNIFDTDNLPVIQTLVTNDLSVNQVNAILEYSILDINGRILQAGKIDSDKVIDINSLSIGSYFITFYEEGKLISAHQFIKN